MPSMEIMRVRKLPADSALAQRPPPSDVPAQHPAGSSLELKSVVADQERREHESGFGPGLVEC